MLRRYGFIAAFLTAPLALYIVFFVSPNLQAIQLAFTNSRGISPNFDYVGFDNFTKLFQDEVFWAAVRHHGIVLLAMPIITIAIALFFSFLLNLGGGQKNGRLAGIWGSGFYKVVFFFPQVLAVVIVGVLFQAVLNPQKTGILNTVLGFFGVDPVGWLINPNIALWTIIGVIVWQSVGFYVVLFSAGMASVPKEVFEAAALDGANRFTLFFRITLPLVWNTIEVGWVYLCIAAFDCFALVQVLSVDRGGPDNSTTVLPLEIFRQTFTYYKFGYSSAMGVALVLMVLTFAALSLRVTRRDRIEY